MSKRRFIFDMTRLSAGPDKQTSGTLLKLIVRKVTPWYGGIVAIYAPAHGIYAWLQGAGLVQVPFQDLMFNVCMMAGLATLCAVLFGAVSAFLGVAVAGLGGILLGILGFDLDEDVFFKRVVWLFAIVGGIGFGGWLLFEFGSDPRDFTATPHYGGLELFCAVLGAAVLVAAYVLFGKKLVDQIKSAGSETEKQS